MTIPHTNHQDSTGTARRFNNPCSVGKNKTASGRKIYIEPPAETMLNELNHYDKLIVCKEIIKLSLNPAPADGAVNTSYPAFMKMKPVNQSATTGNYLIKYDLCRADSVVIVAIGFNKSVLMAQNPVKNERNAMYIARRKKGAVRLTEYSELADIDSLPDSWSQGEIVHKITTRHAAVNGMLNDFRKAIWLMGTHTDVAFQNDNIEEYTLFHNPTMNKGLPDFYETISDKIGLTTRNAKHLAAVLYDNQQRGQNVKWLAHSQGAAIFSEAVRYHNRTIGTQLNKNSIVFHAGAHNRKVTKKILSKAGIKILEQDRNSPFDMVPNLGGFNDWSWNSIKHSILFRKSVKANNNISYAISPHTLPFISLEFYHRQLVATGNNRQAVRVQNLINHNTEIV